MNVKNGTAELPIPVCGKTQILGAFVHVGKTGGSTLSKLLRWGTHSMVMRTSNCKFKLGSPPIENESYISKTAQYYHTPDFGNGNLEKHMQHNFHEYYVFTVRDPLNRAISDYLYEHPANSNFQKYLTRTSSLASNSSTTNVTEAKMVIEHTTQQLRHRKKRKKLYNVFLKYLKLYNCFFTLEDFAAMVGDNSNDFEKQGSNWTDLADSGRCSDVAKLAIHNQIPVMAHSYWSLQRITEPMTESVWNNNTLFVVRLKHNRQDWVNANKYLGQEGDVLTELPPTIRDSTALSYPIKRELSIEGQRRLCFALEAEYKVYFRLLKHAKNL